MYLLLFLYIIHKFIDYQTYYSTNVVWYNFQVKVLMLNAILLNNYSIQDQKQEPISFQNNYALTLSFLRATNVNQLCK